MCPGSSIMQKEFESEQMRPLAKAVTKTLEKVRGLVREQVRERTADEMVSCLYICYCSYFSNEFFI